MKKQWEQCKPGQKLGRWLSPQVTMDRRGDIQLSRVTWELLDEPDEVLVFYDRNSQTIGIRAAHSQTPHHFPVLKKGRHGGRRIRANGLNRQFGVTLTHTVRFKNAFLDEEGMLNLSLVTAYPAYHGRRVGAFLEERKEKLERKRAPYSWLPEPNSET